MVYTRQDLVWAPDPFKSSSTPRLWLVISDGQMPFPGDLLCVACTRSAYPSLNHEVTSDRFESGGKPNQTTYCSPWLIATIKPGFIRNKQGTLTKSFTDTIAKDAQSYVDTG